MTDTTTGGAVQVYRVFIKATPQAIWDAITRPEWTQCGHATGGHAGAAVRIAHQPQERTRR